MKSSKLNLTAFLPTRQDVMGGAVWGFVAFAVLLGLAWHKGSDAPVPAAASATGSLLLENANAAPSGNAPARIAMTPLPASWATNTEIVEGHRVPFINAQQQHVFDLYKRPAAAAVEKPRLAIMAYGIGFDAETTKNAISVLPPEAGIALMPSAPYAERVKGLVRSERRELWVNIPSENLDDSVNEGAATLKTNTPPRGNISYLYNALGDLQDYTGVALSPNSKLAATYNDMLPIIEELALRGLGLVSANNVPALDQMQAAGNTKLPYLASAIDVSAPPVPDAIRAQLDSALSSAQSSGNAFVVLSNINPRILNVLQEWLTLHRSEFVLVPPSALMD